MNKTAAIWKDVTSYSRGEERIPMTWETRFGSIKLVVQRGHLYFRGTDNPWSMKCDPWYGFETRLGGIGFDDIEQAQGMALRLVGAKIEELYACIQELEVPSE